MSKSDQYEAVPFTEEIYSFGERLCWMHKDALFLSPNFILRGPDLDFSIFFNQADKQREEKNMQSFSIFILSMDYL